MSLNTEYDPFSLCLQHGQMAESELVTLVCPFNIWLGQGFYVELFLIDAFPLSSNKKENGVLLTFSMKTHTACCTFA